jgi:hypothetical protein
MAAKKVPARKIKSRTPKKASVTPTPKRASVTLEDYPEGPIEWLSPMLEEAYMKLRPKEEAEAKPSKPASKSAAKKSSFESVHHPGEGESVLASLPRTHWEDRMRTFRERKAAVGHTADALLVGMAAVPGANNWTPLGPSVIAHGQTANRAAISGRVAGIAIAPGGTRLYVASANGGVWRSDDSGQSWVSTMDGFDTNPTSVASASLVCGAIAIDAADPNRVYVGTGEGDTDGIFSFRIVNALPAYRGIGPIRSDDGGLSWVQESSTPSLSGFSFFKIAVDPANREHCVAATSNGLYERIPSMAGFTWTQRRTLVHTSVVVARSGGVTTWFAAPLGGPVVQSPDGVTWTTVGTGFPAGVGRVALGVQPDNPNVLYALIATTGGGVHSVRRLNGAGGSWLNVSGVPAMLPGSQGDYDLAISVDPNNSSLIYLGGDRVGSVGSIWRCQVSPSGSAFSMTAVSIGENAHADVHVVMHAPGDSNTLWAGTDGGIFVNTDPAGTGTFVARNTGLATLCTNFFSQHPLEPAVLFAGLQDNGTTRYTGEEAWRHVLFADGGYCVVNWNNSFKILLSANANVFRATDGGQDYVLNPFSLGSWTTVTPPLFSKVMAAPLVGPPINTGAPAEAEVVALGAGLQVFISSDFGTSWPDVVNLPAGSGLVFSMIFASAIRIFAGTTTGRIFRLDKGASWVATRIDNAAAGALPLTGLVTDIAVDTSDATLNSIFISFGGTGDFRHVWRFNGTAWQSRSGAAGSGTELMDVEHNAIAFDRVTNRVYVGADIGAWESADGGNTWTPLSNGLPDAPVYDLQIHPTARLLRACLHGRGLFELKLDVPALADVELYIRDTMLDTGRGINTDGRADPSVPPGASVVHYLSPNIKVDVPTPAGYQTTTSDIDFLTFSSVLNDGSNGVGTNSPPPTVHNRVYVEVHNRGRVDADLQVMVAITNAATGLMLPSGYTANVVAGTPLAGPKWITLGVRNVTGLRAGAPRIVSFDLPSTSLPLPASLPGDSHYCMVAFLHSALDPFTNTQRNVDLLTLSDRKVGQKNLHIVEFVGTPPSPGTGPGIWGMLMVSGAFFTTRGFADLVIDARNFPGKLTLALPRAIFPTKPAEQAKEFAVKPNSVVKAFVKRQKENALRMFHEAKYSEFQFQLMTGALEKVSAQKALELTARSGAIRKFAIGPEDNFPIFFRIDLPSTTKIGSVFEFDVQQRDSESGRFAGGSRYRVVVNKKVG